MVYTIEAAINSKIFDEVFLSTDSEEYAKIGREWGASIPFLRSEELSSDTASSWDVVKDTLLKYQIKGMEFDTVALLQPTSPLRNCEDIINGYEQMKIRNANAIVSVCETDHSPLWCNTLPEDNSLRKFLNRDLIGKPRQCLPTYYRLNGALYIIKTNYLQNTDNIYEEKCYAVVMSKQNSIDIDDEMDFKIAEVLMKQRKI